MRWGRREVLDLSKKSANADALLDADALGAAVLRAGLVAADGTISYHGLMSHVEKTVNLGAVHPELKDLREEEIAVLFDRIWGAIDPGLVLKLVPVEWFVSAQQVVRLLHLIAAGHTADMPSIQPAVVGKLALSITRAYVRMLTQDAGKQNGASSLNKESKSRTPMTSPHDKVDVVQLLPHATATLSPRPDADADVSSESDAPSGKSDCLLCALTFPVVVDTILALITGCHESSEAARNEKLAVSCIHLLPILEWRGGAFSILERLLLEDPHLVSNDVKGLQEVVNGCDPGDLEFRTDVLQKMLKLAYLHPRVRSQVRFGWHVQVRSSFSLSVSLDTAFS